MEDLEVFLGAAQVGFPVLLDANPVHQAYRQSGATSPYPLDYVIDRLGRVAYASTEYDPTAMIAVIDSLLADTTDVNPPLVLNMRISQVDEPLLSEVLMSISLPRDGVVHLDIHDLKGRFVRRLIDGELLAQGNQVLTWDGRGDNGRSLATGLYLARLRQGNKTVATKIRLVK